MNPSLDTENITQAVRMVVQARQVVALTGAGISVPSGIPAFRGSQGLWEKYDPGEYAHIDAFLADPGRVWGMLLELSSLIDRAEPNPAHLALAELEKLGRLRAIITQNVDNLHQAAGVKDVIEFHGNGSSLVCLDCGSRQPSRGADLSQLPPRCSCGGLLKPEVIFFGEPIPEKAFSRAVAKVQEADLMLVIGTSALVVPASLMPGLAVRCGATVIEINQEPTGLTGNVAALTLLGGAELILPALVKGVRLALEA
ncbi:MAG: NAD-dependent deacylase [Deltaproteobacteria bacterium]|nr:NAD-dependent deacylase [Deltaproteobacteria bacterium]